MIPDKDALSYMSVHQFRQLRHDSGHALLDVRTGEAFAEGHVPDALNLCVYESAFTDKVSEAVPARDTRIIVYGESKSYKAAEVALGRLKAAGYTDVQVLEGGLHAWELDGGRVEKSREKTPRLSAGRMELVADKSHVRWTGRNLTNQHHGEVAIKSGWLELNGNGAPMAGELVVDMTRISCADLADKEMNKGLIAHLNSADFFKVGEHPEAGFRLTGETAILGSSPGRPNYEVTGRMTVRGVTREVEFPAMLYPVEGGVSFQARLEVDRVAHGAVYGSGSLFERLGMHLVNDLVDIQVTAVFG